MIQRIHVNQHILRANKKHGTQDPPLSIKSSQGTKKAHRVRVLGPCEVIYSPDKPLSCGAVCWVETESPLEIE